METIMTKKLSYMKRRDGLTTKMLSELSGVPVGTLNKILNGDTINPAMATMEKIAAVFNVPAQYFTNDNIPLEFETSVFVQGEGLLLISGQERRLLENYRSCTSRGRERLSDMADFLMRVQARKKEYGHLIVLPCYVPNGSEKNRASADTFEITKIMVADEEMTQNADFAVKLLGTDMEPLYRQGDILAIKYGPVKNNQVGIFVYQGEGYIRRLSERGGVRKLVALNRRVSNTTIKPDQMLETIGTVLGVVWPVKILR